MDKLFEFWEWYIGQFSDPDNKVRIMVWSTTIATISLIVTLVTLFLNPIINKYLNSHKDRIRKFGRIIVIALVLVFAFNFFIKNYNLKKQTEKLQTTVEELRTSIITNFQAYKSSSEKRDSLLSEQTSQTKEMIELLKTEKMERASDKEEFKKKMEEKEKRFIEVQEALIENQGNLKIISDKLDKAIEELEKEKLTSAQKSEELEKLKTEYEKYKKQNETTAIKAEDVKIETYFNGLDDPDGKLIGSSDSKKIRQVQVSMTLSRVLEKNEEIYVYLSNNDFKTYETIVAEHEKSNERTSVNFVLKNKSLSSGSLKVVVQYSVKLLGRKK